LILNNLYGKFNLMKKVKRILQYPAVFEPAEEGGYNVSFPAFAGCVTFGRTFEEAKKKAQEILELWLEELASKGQKIPASRFRPIIDEIQARVPAKAKLSYASSYC
jgi:predicted RNase H-like HicB family nuclease